MMWKTKFLIIAMAFFAQYASAALPSAATPVLNPLSAVELQKELKRSDRQTTVINLWATWCDPCKDEMPELIELRKELLSKGTRLFLVSADSPDSHQDAAQFLKKMGVDFSVYRLAEAPDKFMKPFEPHWPAVLPTTMAFDHNGKRIGYWVGRVPVKELKKRLEAAHAKTTNKTKTKSNQKTKQE